MTTPFPSASPRPHSMLTSEPAMWSATAAPALPITDKVPPAPPSCSFSAACAARASRWRQRTSGATLTSYLLFEQTYCRALIALGYKDTMARREEILKFINSKPGGAPQGDMGVQP